MAVKRKGERWIVEFMQRGIRVFIRLPAGSTKADAQQLESLKRRQIFNAVDLGKLPDPLLGKVIDEWLATKQGSKSQAQTSSHAARVRDFVGGERRFSELPDAAMGIRANTDWSNATRNRRLCILKAVAKYAYQQGYIAENLSPKIQLLPEKKYQRREVDPGVITALMDAATTPRARALIAFSAYTGMRLGEVLKLTPKDAVGGFLRLRDTKSGEDREVPIPPELEPHLKQLPFKGGWRNVYRGWLSARRRAGLTLRYHDLRHMAITAMVNAGKSPLVIADVAGHKSLQTTRKYSHPSMEAKRDALGAITAGLQQEGKKKAQK